jgi:flagellar motor component MotA
VIDSGAVVEEVAEDEAMAVAATFETEIEIVTATHETASAIFETRAMDHPSVGMSIATMVIVGTVSSIHEQIA